MGDGEWSSTNPNTRTRSLTRSQAFNQQLKEHFLFAGYLLSRCYALFCFNYIGRLNSLLTFDFLLFCYGILNSISIPSSVTVSNSTESSEFRGLSRQQWNCSWLTELRERQYVVLLYVDIYRYRLHIVQMTLITLYLVPICVFCACFALSLSTRSAN